jgi:hypothetical protein
MRREKEELEGEWREKQEEGGRREEEEVGGRGKDGSWSKMMGPVL